MDLFHNRLFAFIFIFFKSTLGFKMVSLFLILIMGKLMADLK